jgi:integrase
MAQGEGSVFKAKDSKGKTVWKVEVVTGHKPDGTRIRTRRTAKTHAEALQIRRKLVTDRDEFDLSFDNPTLDIFAMWWIRDVRALRVKAATAADYEHRYRKLISPTFGSVKLDAIDSRGVASWAHHLLSDYAQDSVNGALRVLKMLLSAAVEHGHLRTNPATPVPRITSRGPNNWNNPPWDIHEVRRAIAAAATHWFGLPILLALNLGLRKGEILGLKWGDVDLDARLIHIRRSRREFLAYDANGMGRLEVQETAPKTRSSLRTLRIGKQLWSTLWDVAHASPGAPFDIDHRYVALRRDQSSPMTDTVFTRGFKAFLKDSGLRVVRFHDLRHSSAQSALAAGTRIESVSQTLGHSRIDVTKAVYAPSVEALDLEFSVKTEEYLYR